jgi:hypothetical protein
LPGDRHQHPRHLTNWTGFYIPQMTLGTNRRGFVENGRSGRRPTPTATASARTRSSGTTGAFGGGDGVIGIANATTTPAPPPAAACYTSPPAPCPTAAAPAPSPPSPRHDDQRTASTDNRGGTCFFLLAGAGIFTFWFWLNVFNTWHPSPNT